LDLGLQGLEDVSLLGQTRNEHGKIFLL
jgi:hypothetical protein